MNRRGAVLFEVVAALTIFTFAAVGTITLLGQLADTQHRSEITERRVADQNRLMTAYSVLARGDLDVRLGSHAVGPYVVMVERPTSVLYRVSIGDSSGVDLATLFYRPEERHAP